jgi:hypothetical protein
MIMKGLLAVGPSMTAKAIPEMIQPPTMVFLRPTLVFPLPALVSRPAKREPSHLILSNSQ